MCQHVEKELKDGTLLETLGLSAKAKKTHSKGFVVRFLSRRTVDVCTENSHCCAPSPPTHGEKSLPCVTDRTQQKKVTHGARIANGVGWGFAVRWEQNTRQRICLCRAHDKG